MIIPLKNAINETNCISATVMDAGSRTYEIMWNFRCCYTISHPMPTAKLNWVFRILIAPISKYPIHSLNGVIFLQNILWGFNLTGLYFNIAWGRRTRKKKTFIVDQQIREKRNESLTIKYKQNSLNKLTNNILSAKNKHKTMEKKLRFPCINIENTVKLNVKY